MRKITTIISTLLLAVVFCLLTGYLIQTTFAQEVAPQALAQQTEEEIINLELIATDSAESTDSANASPAAQVEQKLIERKAEDITETGGESRGRLSAFLLENPIGPLSWHNFLQHMIRDSVEMGLSANIIVLLLLFPLVASIIAASRHIVGLRGFGIYIPAVLSVAFVSTEIVTGIIIFVAVLFGATITRAIVKKFNLPYLPRTATILWGVSIFILLLLILSSKLAIFQLLTISIFPILIIIILTENFMNSQLFNSQKEALKITLETLLIAIVCSLIISQEQIQRFVLLRPELTLLGTAFINYIIGKYTGLRLLEFLRFSSILGQDIFQESSHDDQSE
ncbi:MAG: Uncharacterized protein XD95_0665 [Microgenomates bacterium 39_7]|nr:MAG: Uncharacterized protein XD95_0665 [Microgenomates bacterium 39_7]